MAKQLGLSLYAVTPTLPLYDGVTGQKIPKDMDDVVRTHLLLCVHRRAPDEFSVLSGAFPMQALLTITSNVLQVEHVRDVLMNDVGKYMEDVGEQNCEGERVATSGSACGMILKTASGWAKAA